LLSPDFVRFIQAALETSWHAIPWLLGEDNPQTAIPLSGYPVRSQAFLFDKLRTGLEKSLSSKMNFLSNLSTKPLLVNLSFCQYLLH